MAHEGDYRRRIALVQRRMVEVGIDVLIVPAPENMYYLTGYDGWSFYLNQCLVLSLDRPVPFWIGRGSDRHVASASPVIDGVHVYGDDYIQSQTLGPYDFVADRIIEFGWDEKTIGAPIDAYYFSPRAWLTLQRRLPRAEIRDDGDLVNWVRVIKEQGEVEAMRRAGAIGSKALQGAVPRISEGLRRADTAATILSMLTAPDDETVGGYSAIAPLLISGEGPARPHQTWSDVKYGASGSYIIEISGVFDRYHCPIARTLSLGKPPAQRLAAQEAQVAVLNMIERDVRPGMTCADVADRCSTTLKQHGFSKAGRFGYSTGIAYPPDWGEHTVSIRAGEKTTLIDGMTLFFIPAHWGDDWSVALGETFHITTDGARRMTDLPYDIIVV
jgi:ectoine hydrolase